MPVGDTSLPPFETVAGLRIGTASAGIKKPGRQDLTIFELASGSRVAGVFTRNAFCAAPVTVAREHLGKAAPRYLLINTGNANAGTGTRGLAACRHTCEALAELTGVEPTQVLPFSTGVIGELLPDEKICDALPQALEQLSERGWAPAANAIMTTDMCPKGASRQVSLPSGAVVNLSGISKGAGMIRPDMATMLGFVAMDAELPQELLDRLLREAVGQSFNRITVDGDTSTNDACMLVATGVGSRVSEHNPEDLAVLQAALNELFVRLATLIVRDGEGATKFIEISVEQAASEQEALDVAYTVAHSPLVKTAFFASDPNWGRLLAAIGRAGVDGLDVEKVTLYLDEVCIAEQGARAESYTEEQGQTVMNRKEIRIRIVLDRGDANERVWTTDLSHDYVRINAEYRT